MDTLGVVESRSIAGGVELTDVMLKAADVELTRAGTVCSGRYTIYVSGTREAVQTAVNAAIASERPLAGNFVLSRISPQVLEALKRGAAMQPGEALGVVECRIVSAGIAAADAAVKTAAVRLVRLVTGQGINGKSYFVLSGDVASVREAVEAAALVLERDLIETVVVPRPEPALVQALTSGVR